MIENARKCAKIGLEATWHRLGPYTTTDGHTPQQVSRVGLYSPFLSLSLSLSSLSLSRCLALTLSPGYSSLSHSRSNQRGSVLGARGRESEGGWRERECTTPSLTRASKITYPILTHARHGGFSFDKKNVLFNFKTLQTPSPQPLSLCLWEPVQNNGGRMESHRGPRMNPVTSLECNGPRGLTRGVVRCFKRPFALNPPGMVCTPAVALNTRSGVRCLTGLDRTPGFPCWRAKVQKVRMRRIARLV